MEYNIYCDESCHLEFDKQPVMLLGAVWCPKDSVKEISSDIRSIKIKYKARGELKWAKVSDARLDFYKSLMNYFVENDNIYFRCLVVKNKQSLDHDYFNKGSHDTFYYKMYFSLLKTILNPIHRYNIYIDIKDTRSNHNIKMLKEVLCNNVYDFTRQMVANIQHIRSHESELLQLADFLTGVVAYKNRGMTTSSARVQLVQLLEGLIGQGLDTTTSLHYSKFNLFVFTPLLTDT